MLKALTNEIQYIGVNDYKVDIFEAQYCVPHGMAYNSYVVLDEKVTVFDTVAEDFADEWLKNLQDALQERMPNYLVVQHMEPDHSANIAKFLELYPHTKVVANSKTFQMIEQFFHLDMEAQGIVVKDKDSLCTGNHTFTFLFAPMVHWPEVMVTYDNCDKALFSADAFGKFGALDVEDNWVDEARRYYIGIVGKYGVQVQALLKKASAFDIKSIYPLHGPVLQDNLASYLEKYQIWSSYEPEETGVTIAYASVYGNTKKAAEILAQELKELGCENVVLHDLCRCDVSEAVADSFRYDKLILASLTYNGDVFPAMKEFLHHLTERNYQKRKIGFIQNGSWAPVAAKVMREHFAKSKDILFADTTVTIKSAINDTVVDQISKLAAEICEK